MLLARLTGAITGGELETGDLLPREEDLAEEFGVSRGVARESIRALEERGLVSVKHGRGAIVNPRSRWDLLDADVLSARLAGPQRSQALDESIEYCMIVETEAAALAAQRATREDRAFLAESLEGMSDAARRSQANPGAARVYEQAELRFDRALLGASGNIALARVTENIQHALEAARPASSSEPARLVRGIVERRRILEAVVVRDPEAARDAMRDLLTSMAEELRVADSAEMNVRNRIGQ